MEAAHQVCRNQDLPNTDSGGGSTNTNKQLWWYVNSNPGNTPYQFLTQGQMSFNPNDTSTYTSNGVTVMGSCYSGDGNWPQHSSACHDNNLYPSGQTFSCDSGNGAGGVATFNNGSWSYNNACNY